MVTRVESSSNIISWTPKQAFGAAKKVAEPTSKVAEAGMALIDTIDNSSSLADVQLPHEIEHVSTFFHFLNLPMIPFKIAKLGKMFGAALKARDWKAFGRTVLDTLAFIPSVVLTVVVSPYQILKSLKAIGTIQAFGVLNTVLWPFSIIEGLLDTWELGKQSKSFHVIRTGAKNLNNEESAVIELDRLKKLDLKEVGKQLEVSKQCKIAEKIDTLRERLLNKEPEALKDTKEFYAKMKKRAALTLSLKVVSLVLTITTIVLSAILLFTPVSPAALGVALGVIGLTAFCMWAGKRLFLKDDIFDPTAKNLAQRSVTWIKDHADKFHKTVQYIFNPKASCMA